MVENKISHVLDLGAGVGTESLYCASFGAKVDWVDKRKPPNYFTNHPLINTKKTEIEKFKLKKRYDLIILKFVLPFLGEKFIYNNLFPNIIKSLNSGGFLLINGFCKRDSNLCLPESSVFFSKRDLEKYLAPLVLKTYGKYKKEHIKSEHKKYTHLVQIAVLRKENDE